MKSKSEFLIMLADAMRTYQRGVRGKERFPSQGECWAIAIKAGKDAGFSHNTNRRKEEDKVLYAILQLGCAEVRSGIDLVQYSATLEAAWDYFDVLQKDSRQVSRSAS